MDESLNQSISVKKPIMKIKQKKAKYLNLTIFLLIIHLVSILLQKNLEYKQLDIKKTKLVKDIFLVCENICIEICIVIFLCKIKNNLILLFSILYLLIGIVMLFYFFLNKYCNIPKREKMTDIDVIIFYLINNILFLIEGILLFFCSEIIEKAKIIANRQKYGYKNDENNLLDK